MAEPERPVSDDCPVPPAQGPVPGIDRPRSDPQPGPHSPPPPTEDAARPSNKAGSG